MLDHNKKVKKKPSLLVSLLPIVFMILMISIGYAIYDLAVEPILVCVAFFSAFIAWRLGYTWKEMEEAIYDKIMKSMQAILILWSVGFIIGSWMYSGTVPMIIYYGLQIIHPKYLLVTGFLLTALVSTATGTSWGSAGTMGVAIIGIGQGLGVPLPITAGAVVSGAYFGDKLSPLSDSTNIAPIAAGSELYEHIRHMFYTTLPTAGACIIVFTFMGFKLHTEGSFAGESTVLIQQLSEIYNFNILLLLPPIIMIYGSIKKFPPMPTMLGTSILAVFIGKFVQGFSMSNGFKAMTKGFHIDMVGYQGEVTSTLSTLLNRGGAWDAAGTTVLIIAAMGFAGIIDVTGMLDVVINAIAHRLKTTFSLIAGTAFSTITMAIVSGSSYITILIPGELFAEEYVRRNLAPKNLSRTLEDSGTVVVGIVPWSAAGAFMTNTLGVPTAQYLPWAIFCWGGVIMAMICAATGFGIAPLDPSKPIINRVED